jgi:Skp family chaperone for outer membrane proteins
MIMSLCAPLDRVEASDGKIGLIDLKEVYTGSSKIKRLSEDLKKYTANAENQINKLQADLTGMQEKLKKGDVKGGERTRLENRIKAKQEEIAQEKHELSVKMSFKRKSLQNSVRIQVEQATRTVADKKGLNGVIAEAAVVYPGAMPDITADVIKELDGSSKADQAPEARKGPNPEPEKKVD